MSRRGTALCSAAVALVLLATACTAGDEDDPEDDAEAFAAALASGDLTGVSFAQTTPRRAQQLWDRIRVGMGDSELRVEVLEVTEPEEDTATATLGLAWALEGSSATWTHETTLDLVRGEEGWEVDLVPGAPAPGLAEGERLRLSSVAAERGDIVGRGGRRLVTERPVLRFGIDKTLVEPDAQGASARALADLLDLDAAALVDRVESAGDKAFVEAVVLRVEDVTPALDRRSRAIAGVRALPDELALAPTREFARPILGSVGPVTAQIVEDSDGAYAAGDLAGLSGLQQRYDEQLRGEPGVIVEAVEDDSSEGAGESRELFRTAPQDGKPLRVTLDAEVQAAAEGALAGVGPASAVVALRPSTGEVLAAASGPGSGGYSTATVGQYAPGSTFKVVSSLALLRAGVSVDDTLPCPAWVVVDGKAFENYDDYPAGSLGRITLREAVAGSCNTAFISQHERVDAADVAEAAAALGLGEDHDVGFPSFFGSVPVAEESATQHAADLIGQGKVLASPLAMAAVAGSVAAGRTVVPHLVVGAEPTAAPSAPLTGREADQLRTLMAAVVSRGSGAFLADLPGGRVLAKTGTAEFGEEDPPRTHAWMIAVRGDLAVAVFVEVGESGSRTAGPVLEEFLRATA